MSDQEQRPESDADGLEAGSRYVGNPENVQAAVRVQGEARGLTSANNPLYAHLLNLAHRLDDPFLSDQYVPALSNEFRQIVKQLGLDKFVTAEKGEVNILASLGSNIKRPTRSA